MRTQLLYTILFAISIFFSCDKKIILPTGWEEIPGEYEGEAYYISGDDMYIFSKSINVNSMGDNLYSVKLDENDTLNLPVVLYLKVTNVERKRVLFEIVDDPYLRTDNDEDRYHSRV